LNRFGVKATISKAKAKAKDLTFKAKAKDLASKAKAKAKDLNVKHVRYLTLCKYGHNTGF